MKKETTDKNFDRYAARMRTNIYGSLKGKIRLEILLNDLSVFLKNDQNLLKILDAGCGGGQCSSVLARQGGHHITLCDISENMLKDAKTIFSGEGLKADFIHSSIQDHAIENSSKYDVILCHAVLEWVEDPLGMLHHLKNMLKPGGHLSLMFFNLNGIIFKTVLRGNVYRQDEEFKFGQTKSLTPTNPLNPETVYQWLRDLNFKTIEKSGIRIFYDHLDRATREKVTESQVLECEASFSKSEPFLSMARYVHVLCQKN